MAKWADYLISGIWMSKPKGTHIAYVLLHEDKIDDFEIGVKTSRADVIKLLKAEKTIKTIQWDYHSANWSQGADVGWIDVAGKEYLRSHEDGTVNDNLDNLIKMNHILG